MWSLFLCLLAFLNYSDAKLQLASKSSASKNKDWTIWIKKIETQKGIFTIFILNRDSAVVIAMNLNA